MLGRLGEELSTVCGTKYVTDLSAHYPKIKLSQTEPPPAFMLPSFPFPQAGELRHLCLKSDPKDGIWNLGTARKGKKNKTEF